KSRQRTPAQHPADGSLTLYAGAKSSGADKESNWLPALNGPFSLYIRAYWTDKTIINGSWMPPAVHHGTQVRVARTCVWMSLLAQSGLLPVEGDPRLQQKCRGRMLSGSWLMIRSTSGTPTTPSPCSRQCICAMALT